MSITPNLHRDKGKAIPKLEVVADGIPISFLAFFPAASEGASDGSSRPNIFLARCLDFDRVVLGDFVDA